MDKKELDSMISKISKELLQNMEVTEVDEILKSYKTLDWEYWLKDIISLGIAYPISNLIPDGDIIIDIVNYLRKNIISTYFYEIAVSNILITEYHQNPQNVILLERLIDASISLSGSSANKILITILVSRINSLQKGKTSYIKTGALLALTKSTFLSDENKKEIYNYIVLQGLNQMRHDPYFYSTAMRFCYLQVSVDSFFNMLTMCLIEIEEISNQNIKESIEHLLIDKIEELHFAKLPVFYNNFYSWLITTQVPNHSSKLCSNSSSIKILNEIGELINKNSISLPQAHQDLMEEAKYEDAVVFLLSIAIEKDISIEGIFDIPKDLIKVLLFITSQKKSAKNLFAILKSKANFISTTKMRLVPVLNESKKNFITNKSLLKISKKLDEILQSPDSNIKTSIANIPQLAAKHY